MAQRLVLPNDQGQACREKKNIRAGWKGFEHSQGAGKSWEADLGRKGGENAYFHALTSAADM